MIAELKKTTEYKMQKSLEALQHDLAKVRTGRAHTGLLDHVQVDPSITPRAPFSKVTMATPMSSTSMPSCAKQAVAAWTNLTGPAR